MLNPTFRVYLQILPDRLDITMIDGIDMETATKMVDNLRAQGFKAWATVEVAQ